MRLKGKPWRIELPSFGECVDYRKRTRHKLEPRWSRGVFVGVRVKTTERTVLDETWTYVVPVRETSARRAAIRPQIAAERAWNALGAESR